ncbi:RNHCP domain-containing protein [Streptodolium elevatio]|uniref:RNHCP domain-containing protein n=1 Tax=Streptodolium elevatio TaxID=3157996 RepID=A0ABV3DX25_9ACTN
MRTDVPSDNAVHDDFACPHCGLTLRGAAPDGGPRTHCPSCLHARHGAARDCGRRMAPISIAVSRDGAWTLIHRCTGCRELTASRVRDDDNQLLLMRTAVRPLAQPPFPLDAFGDL